MLWPYMRDPMDGALIPPGGVHRAESPGNLGPKNHNHYGL